LYSHVQAYVCAGRGAGVPERRRAGVPACPSGRVCVCTGARVCACVSARAWVDSSHPFIYQPPTERVRQRVIRVLPGSARACARMCVRVCTYVCVCVCVYVDVYVYTRQNRFNKALTLYCDLVPYVCSVTKTKYNEKLRRQNC